MSTKKPSESALVAAAKGLDQEIDNLARMAEELRVAPLTTQRQLERASAQLSAIAKAEDDMRARVLELGAALKAANETRDAQQQIVARRSAEIDERANVLKGLLEMFGALGPRVAPINARIADMSVTRTPPEELAAADAELAALAADCEPVIAAAREAGFTDVQRNADAIRQQLGAARARLMTVRRR